VELRANQQYAIHHKHKHIEQVQAAITHAGHHAGSSPMQAVQSHAVGHLRFTSILMHQVQWHSITATILIPLKNMVSTGGQILEHP